MENSENLYLQINKQLKRSNTKTTLSFNIWFEGYYVHGRPGGFEHIRFGICAITKFSLTDRNCLKVKGISHQKKNLLNNSHEISFRVERVFILVKFLAHA